MAATMMHSSSGGNTNGHLKLDSGTNGRINGSDSDGSGQSSLEQRLSSDEEDHVVLSNNNTANMKNIHSSDDEEDDDEDDDEEEEVVVAPEDDNKRFNHQLIVDNNDESVVSSENETIVDGDNDNSIGSNQFKDGALQTQTSALASLMNLKSLTESTFKQRQSTGKLEKITERLAQKQNGASVFVWNF